MANVTHRPPSRKLGDGEILKQTTQPVTAGKIMFEIPPAADSRFAFKRAFLGAIRSAIAEAQLSGEIDTAVAVECLNALPMASDPK